MLILAGVSINAIVGENGVLTKAQKAKLTSEEAARREALEIILFEYNSSEFLGEANGITEYLKKMKENGKIDDYAFLGQLMVKYDGIFYGLVKQDEYYKIGSQMSTNLGENAAGGNYIVTTENADDAGNLQFTKGSTYAIVDKISAEGFNFVIPSAKGDINNAVTIYLSEDMTIDNKNYPGRSAIELEDGAILNLYVYGKVNVNSSFGEVGETATGSGAKGGPGGRAGIHVPKNATLNLYGTGILTAVGGDAGDGGGSKATNVGGGGGGGAGAGIGGNGGNGGNGNSLVPTVDYEGGLTPIEGSGTDGGAGEDCGNINISGDIVIYAYGGSGGGSIDAEDVTSSSGGGGYPAAGIGGGGAGGGGADHACSAGGYSAGFSEAGYEAGKNGGIGDAVTSWNRDKNIGSGGSYYCLGPSTSLVRANYNQGGMFAYPNSGWQRDHSGDGGTAGSGGNITYDKMENIHAYNGNQITEKNFDYTIDYYGYNDDGTLKTSGIPLKVITKSNNTKIIPAYIYAQDGIFRAVYKTNQHMTKEECEKYKCSFFVTDGEYKTESVKISDERISESIGYVDSITGIRQGIGSGAGNLEKSNGTFIKNN